MADTKVRRVKAEEATTAKKPKASAKAGARQTVKKSKPKAKKTTKEQKSTPAWLLVVGKPFFAIGRYMQGAGEELKQTRWPNRKATWGLTIAVILFSAFFAGLILLADFGFDQLLELVLGV